MRIVNLLVYSASWCRDCREAKRFLDSHEIPYTEIDIEENPEAAEEVFAHTGKYAIPQFVIDGEWVQPYRPGRGFLYKEMSDRFGVSATPPGRTGVFAGFRRS
ncbi:MAG TPA: glutaredoxin family protein [Acidobacteriaceae bacterium]|jgi:mycoredoxin|nr:glutaredoxin family protein [Acidobacteriaceae bacterium]